MLSVGGMGEFPFLVLLVVSRIANHIGARLGHIVLYVQYLAIMLGDDSFAIKTPQLIVSNSLPWIQDNVRPFLTLDICASTVSQNLSH